MADVREALEDRILDDLTDGLANLSGDIHVGDRRFRLAYLEETPGIDEDAIVLIEPATGDLYEVEIAGVYVRQVEQSKDEPQV